MTFRLRDLRDLLSLLTPSEQGMLAFLAGWALLGLAGSALPWTASFSSDGRERVVIPPDDPRAELHAKSAALAAHLAAARTPPAHPIDPNQAPKEELDRLPGVGPRTALRWIRVRESGGPFFALSDLRRVRGVGPVRLKKMAPYLLFPARESRRQRAPSAGRVSLNRATESELAELPRVGPALAARIVARRISHGRFRSLADLDSVPGVGPVVLRELSERVTFE